jgi:hypothetical protein
MLVCNEVDVVYVAHVLQLYVPLGELLRYEVETVALVGDVVVLQKVGPNIPSLMVSILLPGKTHIQGCSLRGS